MEIEVDSASTLVQALNKAQEHLQEPYIINLIGSDKDYGLADRIEENTDLRLVRY